MRANHKTNAKEQARACLYLIGSHVSNSAAESCTQSFEPLHATIRKRAVRAPLSYRFALQAEADPHLHLEFGMAVLMYRATNLLDLEPVDIAQGLACL